ncbi:MAG: xanthine dehydrogenase small subunit [Pseudomonadota bacterium]
MTELVRFFVNGCYQEVENPSPTTTILEYLRSKPGLTGTKEGCAEGDCGACTVVVAELDQDTGFGLRSVNSCIQFLPTLDGKALITVEGLSKEGELHPVQRAMVECHGSQCGFCTPGFVMSLFTLFQDSQNPDREEMNHALAGNLCRCTGYRPILDAAKTMYDYDVRDTQDWMSCAGRCSEKSDELLTSETELIEQLQSIQRKTTLELNNRQHYFAPLTLSNLAELYQRYPNATILAGGTDIGLWVTKQFRELPVLIYLGDVAEAKQVTKSEDWIDVGAGVSLNQGFEALLVEYPGLKEMFRRFASPPICNAGTLVGNVANGSPIGDSMPALMCLGASVLLRCGDTTRRVLLDELYLGYMENDMKPGEFIQSLRVPANANSDHVVCYKLSKRFDQDISGV